MADTVSRRQSRGPPDVKSRSTRPPEVSEGCGGKTAHPVPPCTCSPSSSGIALPSSPTIPHHIGRVGCKGFPVNLSTSKSLGVTKPECLHQGFHLPCHLSTSIPDSTSPRFTPKATSNYHLPTTGIPYPSAQLAPHGKTRPRLVVIPARSTQPSLSTHPRHTRSTLIHHQVRHP